MDVGIPIDIIIFAMVAAYLVYRLRNALGRRDGSEGNYRDPFRDNKDTPDSSSDDAWAEPDEDGDNVVQLTDRTDEPAADAPIRAGETDVPMDDGLQDGIAAIRKLDASFDAEGFLDGACAAFEMILGAYTDGDTDTLKTLLSPDVYGNFSQAIRDREQAGEVLEDTLVGIDKAVLLEAYVEDRHAFVTVKFVSQQINATRDENGDVVDGDPHKVIGVTDFWTFSRDTKMSDPNWALVATQSAD